MSPTSYQAAPPRASTISDARASVKPLQAGFMILRFSEGTATTSGSCSFAESQNHEPSLKRFDGSARVRYSGCAGWSSLVARRAHNRSEERRVGKSVHNGVRRMHI